MLTKRQIRYRDIYWYGKSHGWEKPDGIHYKVPQGYHMHHLWYSQEYDENSFVIISAEEHYNEHAGINGSFGGKKTGGWNKKCVLCVETGIIYESVTDAERCTNIQRKCISRVCNGRRKTTGGFHWKFI